MERRGFIRLSAITGLGFSLAPLKACNAPFNDTGHSKETMKLYYSLLKDWCDGMIHIQVVNPNDMTVHGSLDCPSCLHIHGRCMDAVYPFMFMADKTGEKKYLDAAVLVMQWAENNVSQEDGSWTVIPNPKSWKGISVFGAIALAEGLHYHGHILDDDLRQQWMDRLARVGDYIYKTFTISFTNINYGGTAVYGLNLLGRVLGNDSFIVKSHRLAADVKAYFTKNNNLLFGEIKPDSNKTSAKGLKGVDLGYNVEETLNGLVMYALHEKDEELLQILQKSLDSHLAFMLPDGAWDNSWGTRQYKWSYWGSRTCDGSQPAFAMMAKYNGAYATAAIKNTELLRRCTANGLLHGGPHFVSHGVKPCVHHTFAHAKPLASLLDHWAHLPEQNTNIPLPREVVDGLTYYKDLDVSLFARGDWRGTISAYDAEYHYKHDYRQATGGALAMLYHAKVGTILTASMAVYKLVEVNNQQEAAGEDIALTPRVETYKDGVWFTNLFDLTATFKSADVDGKIGIDADVLLKNESRDVVNGTANQFKLTYTCTVDKMQIAVSTYQDIIGKTALVLPIVSQTGEKISWNSPSEMTIEKSNGLVLVKANAPLGIKSMSGTRTFNQVPGVEAIPVIATIPEGEQSVTVTIEIVSYVDF